MGGVDAALTGSGGVALLLVRPQPVSLAGGSGGASAAAAGSTRRRRRRVTCERRAGRGQAAGAGAPRVRSKRSVLAAIAALLRTRQWGRELGLASELRQLDRC